MVNGYNFLDPMNHSTYLENSYPSTYEEALNYGESLSHPNLDGAKLKPQPQKDGYYKQDGVDDGKITTFEKIKAFLKGGTSNIVKGLFCDENGFSIKRTLLSATGAAAIALTGPIGAAVAGGVGLLAAAGKFIKSTSLANSAVNDQQAREAYEGLGESTTIAGLSLWGGFKGLKALKNNFSFFKSNPDLNIKTADKFIKWNAGKHVKPAS